MNEENEWDHKISAEVKEAPADCIRMAEVRAVLKKMKRHKASGLSGLVAEMIQATEDIGTYCERRKYPRGLEIKCGSANLQRQRRPYGVWIVQRDQIAGTCNAGTCNEEELIKRLSEWKDNVESKGVRVSVNKTKVMISGERQKVRQKAIRWPCGVFSKGVGSNSLQCTSCQKWVHKKCSGMKGSMSTVAKSFICNGLFEPGN